ncbi:MAG: glutathione S-transferase N-terminal domain-containing protein [Sphingomonas sp.]|uniref:glutathione S-transferase N-terminal domain-containing protein n=1 Tax=Sphingomonas sp. TaxID=28214 RepID=UPI001828BE57|nr:glutathione S-transferase N-terminal domain-containing protein [Sphingomonas sp.]MBA3667404.1 glutathione S-transferase N-terminal domain-containing protein [Sphingomonas sp.]
MINLHYVPTGNNLKIAIMLHETGLPYQLVKYSMLAGSHLTPEFRRINPNNKLPAIVDMDPADAKGPLSVFESGAILLYLAEKTSNLISSDFRKRLLTLQWLTWQVAGLGPMLGQATHFQRYAPEGQDYGRTRYNREALRHIDVMEYRLREADYLAEEFSIADIACFPWASGAAGLGISMDDHPAVSAWLERVKARPSVAAATAAIYDEDRKRFMAERVEMTPDEWSNMFGDRMYAAARVAPRAGN